MDPCRAFTGFCYLLVLTGAEVVIDVGELFEGIQRPDYTQPLQHLLDSVSPHTRIVIPSNVNLTIGPLQIKSDFLTLQLDGILQAREATPSEFSDGWPKIAPLVTYGDSRDLGFHNQYQALLYATNVSGLHLTGTGTVDGNGLLWWDAYRNHSTSRLLQAGRPNLIQIVNSSDIEIDSLTLINAAFWTVHPVLSQNIYIHHLTIRAPLYSPNVDGIDPDSCRNVLIEHNDVSCGDDHIAIKAGVCGESSPNDCRDPVWKSGAYATKNVTVRWNMFRTGMGIAVGSEMSGGVSDVQIYNNTVGLCDKGSDVGRGCGWGPALHVKTTITRGGTLEDIAFHSNTVFNNSMFIFLEMSYQTKEAKPPIGYPATKIQNISFVSNQAIGLARSAIFSCSKYDACGPIVAINNHILNHEDNSPWGCEFIANYTVMGNTPDGLEKCMENSMFGPMTRLGQDFLIKTEDS